MKISLSESNFLKSFDLIWSKSIDRYKKNKMDLFKIKNYFMNYYLIMPEKIGKEIYDKNWAEYVEYRTVDDAIIELQNIGMPWYLSMIIKNDYAGFSTFEEGTLVDINVEMLIQNLDCNKYKDKV